jgi:hypothetical protein
MTTPRMVVEGFSITHAAILGANGLQDINGDIYGVRDGSVDVDSDSYDNTGDDAVLSTWYWLNFANISVQGGYIPLELLALLSGETLGSSGTGSNDYYNLPMWTLSSMNQAPRAMFIRMPSKDQNGATRQLDFVFYKVQFAPFNFDGPTYKDGLLLNYSGRALLSDKDERGTTLGIDATTGNQIKAIGRIISRP